MSAYFSAFHLKDPVSAITHFIAFLAAAAATAPLLLHAAGKGAGAGTLWSLAIYMLSMLLLYAASTAYHSFRLSPKGEKRLKRLDHMMIFVLIAGSYTPICVTALGRTGIWLLVLVWGVALGGMVLKFCFVGCPKWVSSVLYIGMGWLCVLVLPKIYRALGLLGFLPLLLGGVFYTAGGVIYALKCKRFNQLIRGFGNHELFHLFVMAGSLCHYITMYAGLPI